MQNKCTSIPVLNSFVLAASQSVCQVFFVLFRRFFTFFLLGSVEALASHQCNSIRPWPHTRGTTFGTGRGSEGARLASTHTHTHTRPVKIGLRVSVAKAKPTRAQLALIKGLKGDMVVEVFL